MTGLIIAIGIVLYFLFNTIIMMSWIVDGFLTRYKTLEVISLLFFGLPILLICTVVVIIFMFFERGEE